MKPAVRLAHKRGLDDRQHGRDAAACGEAHIGFGVSGIKRREEMPHGGHDLKRGPDRKLFIGEAGKDAAVDLLDGDAELIVIDAGADRIGASHILSVDQAAERQMLPLREAIVLAQGIRHMEGDGDGMIRLLFDSGDCEAMKSGHDLSISDI